MHRLLLFLPEANNPGGQANRHYMARQIGVNQRARAYDTLGPNLTLRHHRRADTNQCACANLHIADQMHAWRKSA